MDNDSFATARAWRYRNRYWRALAMVGAPTIALAALGRLETWGDWLSVIAAMIVVGIAVVVASSYRYKKSTASD
jgi:hypothetical protein